MKNRSATQFFLTVTAGALIGGGIGLAIAPPHSHFDVYQRAELGAGRAEIVEMLRADGTFCGTARTARPELECRFRDSWREYHLEFGEDGTLQDKFFGFR